MEIRAATPADNEPLLGLCREAPMRGVVSAYVDRAPDFFRFSRLQGEHSRVWAAEREGRLLGCVAQATRRARHRGREIQVVYGGDLKVHPRARGERLGVRLSQHVIQQGQQVGAEVAEGVVIHGNDPATAVVDLVGEGVPVAHAGHVSLYQIPPVLPYRAAPGYHVRRAEPADRPALLEVLRASYRDYAFAPVFDERWLDRELGGDPSFDLSSFRVAERNGRIVAAAAFWDQHPLRRTVVLRFNRVGNAMVPALRAARPLLGLPRLPRPGDPLRYVFLRFPAALPGHVRGLGALLRTELAALRRGGRHHFVWASFHQADPLQDALRWLFKIRMQVHLFHFALQPGVTLTEGPAAARTPAYVDFSVV
jgi:predicted N-acetyltransferase YhbS